MDHIFPRQLSLFDDPSFYESADVELKSAKGGVPSTLWDTYSAFANTNGGTIYLGIAEKGANLDVHGIDAPSKMMDQLWSSLNNKNKVSLNILRSGDIDVIKFASKDVIKINVPRASRNQRPIYINNDPMAFTYRRDHTGDYKCSPDEVRRMFADQSSDPADSRILEHFTMDDLHTSSLQQYRNRVASSNPNHPWLLEDDRGLLQKLGGWRRERATGHEGVTVAGLLMFGLEQAIRSPEAMPQYQLDYRERLGDDGQRWSDRVTLDGTWEGNLFQFYNRVLPRMVTTLKSPFQIDAGLYRFDDTSVAVALREAAVNALIHADYGGQGGIVIDRFGDRIELSNPGTLLISHEQMLKGGISECRNKSLQQMFQLMGAGDKAGSGLDKIRASWDDARFRSPRLKEAQHPDRVSLTLPMVSVLPESALSRLQEYFGNRVEQLSPEDAQILVMTLEEGEVTNARLQEVLTIHRTDLTKTLQALVRTGFLKRTGIGRWTRYELDPSDTQTRDKPLDLSSDLSSDLSLDLSLDLSSDLSSSASTPFERERDPASWLSSSNHLAAPSLIEAARPSRARRLTADQLQHAILQLFEEAPWLTISELSGLLQRDSADIRKRAIRPLLNKGSIYQRYPSERHPHQAYGLTADVPRGDVQE